MFLHETHANKDVDWTEDAIRTARVCKNLYRTVFCNVLCISMRSWSVVFAGRAVEEQQSLMELGVRPQGSTRMEMSSSDPTTHPLRPLRPPEHDNMPDVITVRVQTGANASQPR